MLTGKGGSAQGLMSTVFGDRGAAVGEALGQSAGVKSGTASQILSMALPVVTGFLGKHALENHMTAGGLTNMLFSQKKAIADDPSTPPGLAGALGLGSLGSLGGSAAEVGKIGEHVSGAASRVPESVRAPLERAKEALTERRRSPWGLLLPALLLGAILIWGISSLTRRHGPDVGVTAPQPSPTLRAPGLPKVGPAPAVESGHVVLPGGKALDVTPDSSEARLAQALGDTSTSLPRAFDLEHLNFATGSAAIPAEAAKGLDEVAAMMKAYPSARIRVMGHTDSVGSQAVNQALSDSRAKAIKEALVTRGVAEDRIEAAGEGARRPVPGTQEGESAANRRAVLVLLSR
jgi:outer membrane protein OmpA-like peptidoglycan-associated protein